MEFKYRWGGLLSAEDRAALDAVLDRYCGTELTTPKGAIAAVVVPVFAYTNGLVGQSMKLYEPRYKQRFVAVGVLWVTEKSSVIQVYKAEVDEALRQWQGSTTMETVFDMLNDPKLIEDVRAEIPA